MFVTLDGVSDPGMLCNLGMMHNITFNFCRRQRSQARDTRGREAIGTFATKSQMMKRTYLLQGKFLM